MSEKQIKDKSKADIFVKTIAVLQIGWLVLSVVAREAQDIPTSQLEIVTLAFAILAIFIYLGNFYKPKDIGIAVDLIDKEHIPRDITATGYTSFTGVIGRAASGVKNYEPRVPNDSFRSSDLAFQNVLLAVSAFIFEGLHLLGWNFAFATNTEKWIWRAAGIITACIPMVTLVLYSLADLYKSQIRRTAIQDSSPLQVLHDMLVTWLDNLEEELVRERPSQGRGWGITGWIRLLLETAKLSSEDDVAKARINTSGALIRWKELDDKERAVWLDAEHRVSPPTGSSWQRPQEGFLPLLNQIKQ